MSQNDDHGNWDDDDDYWTFQDGAFLEQTTGLDHNRHKIGNYDIIILNVNNLFIDIFNHYFLNSGKIRTNTEKENEDV